jgi:hypothetical protein
MAFLENPQVTSIVDLSSLTKQTLSLAPAPAKLFQAVGLFVAHEDN